MTDLARFMTVSAAAMTGIMDRLVRDGYAARGYDTKDRRIIKAKLAGRKAKMRVRAIRLRE